MRPNGHQLIRFIQVLIKQNFAQQKRMEGKLAILFAIKGTVEFTFEIFTNINSYNLELKVSEFKYTFKFINF